MELLGIRPDFMSSTTTSGMYDESSEPVPHIDGTGPPPGEAAAIALVDISGHAQPWPKSCGPQRPARRGDDKEFPRAAAERAGMKVRTADGT